MRDLARRAEEVGVTVLGVTIFARVMGKWGVFSFPFPFFLKNMSHGAFSV